MAILGTVFLVMSLSFISGSLFYSKTPEQQGYAVEVAESSGGGAEEEDSGPAFEPVGPLLASADVGAGEKTFKKCAACHTNEEGGANKVGPALYGVVERAIASVDGFSYSGALKEYGADKTWNYESLNGFLWKPKTYIKGTSMGFGGIKKVEERAELIAYLRSLSASPAPLPAAESEPEPASTETSEPEATESQASENSEAATTEESDTSASPEPTATETTEPEASESTDSGEGETSDPETTETSEPETTGSDSTTTTD